MVKRIVIICVIITLINIGLIIGNFSKKQSLELNMANTLTPIIDKLAEEKCNFTDFQQPDEKGWIRNGALIYKREKSEGCISGWKNAYYIRCYNSKWINERLYVVPLQDISLDCYSCIDEKDLLFPSHYLWQYIINANLGDGIEIID